MRCVRCEGLMVLEQFKDFGLESCDNGFLRQRCINCGAIVDPVIAAHRRFTLQAAKEASFPMGRSSSGSPRGSKQEGSAYE